MPFTGGENKLEFQAQHRIREGGEMDWKKTLMIGSFAAGAILFLTGRRPAGLAVDKLGNAAFPVWQGRTRPEAVLRFQRSHAELGSLYAHASKADDR